MSIISSPLLHTMLQSLRKASRALIRDFSEVGYLQASYTGASDFTRSAYSRAGRTIADELRNYRQDYKVIFENDKSLHNKDDYIWFINPMDSRTNFMSSLAPFTTSVALIHNNEAIAAVIDAPVLKETFYAEKGRGAFAEDGYSHHMKMRISNKQSLNIALVDCNITNNQLDIISNKLVARHAMMRSIGSIYLGFSYLGAARYNALVYSHLHQYKAAVGMLFAQESGGKATYDNNIFIASNNILHDLLYS